MPGLNKCRRFAHSFKEVPVVKPLELERVGTCERARAWEQAGMWERVAMKERRQWVNKRQGGERAVTEPQE